MRILRRLGYQVVTACTGREALDHLGDRHTPIDAVLLDIKLPDMDGAALYPASRERRPAAKVIVCNGYALDGPTQALLNAGADGFIQSLFHWMTWRRNSTRCRSIRISHSWMGNSKIREFA